MYNLRLLQVNGVNLEGDLDQLSSRLRWLRWQEYPLQLINFYLKRLVVLDLSHSRIIQAWNRELQGKVMFLNFSFMCTCIAWKLIDYY